MPTTSRPEIARFEGMRASAYYRWEPPGHSTRVELSLDAIDEFNSLIERASAVLDSEERGRGRETGAILLGRRMDSGAVSVDGFEEIPRAVARKMRALPEGVEPGMRSPNTDEMERANAALHGR